MMTKSAKSAKIERAVAEQPKVGLAMPIFEKNGETCSQSMLMLCMAHIANSNQEPAPGHWLANVLNMARSAWQDRVSLSSARKRLTKSAKEFRSGLLHFASSSLSVPDSIRAEMSAAAKQVQQELPWRAAAVCSALLLEEALGANTAHPKQPLVGAFTFSSCRGKAGTPSTAEVLASFS